MRKRGNEGSARANKHSHARRSGNAANKLRDDDLLEIVRGVENPFLLILDCVQDPHNLGAILRSADGAGVDAVVVPKDKSAGITETVRRISVGAADHVPLVQVTNLSRSLTQLKELGVWLVGTSDAGEKSIYETQLTGGLAIVMGAEGKGMRRLTEEACDFLVQIPMQGKVECLNVSVATGVCLYEAVRQRSGVVPC